MSYEAFQLLRKSYVPDGWLKVYYDFNTGGVSTQPAGNFNAQITNKAANSGYGLIIGATGVNSGASSVLGSGFVSGGFGDLMSRNVLVSGDSYLSGIPMTECSALCVFENIGDFKDGVLFGSLFETGYSYGGSDYTGYFGFNVGVTDRGNLFIQTPSLSGIEVNVAHSIELSRKNIVSFSVDDGVAQIGRYDPINQRTKSESFDVWKNPNKFAQRLVIGGSDLYYGKSSYEQTSFSGKIESLALFSGGISAEVLGNLSSGMLAAYFYDSGSINYTTAITGTITTPLYASGVTGYSSGITGYKYVLTGYSVDREVVTGASLVVSEGERGFRMNNGFQEEVGLFLPSNFGLYNPSNESAEGTKGLTTDLITYTGYTTQKVIRSGFYPEPLYGITPLIGVTDTVTGYTYTELTGLVFDSATPASSGSLFTGLASPYMKNRIHFVGRDYV